MPKFIKDQVPFYERDDWGSERGFGFAHAGKRDLFVLHHSWKPDLPCATSLEDEMKHVKGIERFHDDQWHRGIGYHFLVSQRGVVFEGQGWLRKGTHVGGHNTRSFGVCFLINGDERQVTPEAENAAKKLLEWGDSLGMLAADYEVGGHRDFSAKSCPGDFGYEVVERLRSESPSSPPLLRQGDQGPWVKELQKLLGITADGAFGPITDRTVRAFQQAQNLAVDGIVGSQTWDKLSRGQD